MAIGCSQFLSIVKGIPPAPSDPNSAENAMESIDLLDAAGIALNVNSQGGWIPSSNAYKNDGLTADSQIANGSIPIAFADMDIVETMQCTLGNASIQQRNAMLAKLSRMRQAVEDFWTTGSQIDPVYIDWWAVSGSGHQYSLIKSLSFTVNRDSFDGLSAWDLTIVVKREPRWRWLWPAGNPLEYWFQSQGKVRGSAAVTGYDYQDMSLFENQNHVLYQRIRNQHELSTDYVTPITQNYVDIPADRIPGDLPALVLIDILPAASAVLSDVKDFYIAKSTKPITKSSHPTVKTHKTLANLNVGDATAAAGLTKTSDATRGLISNGSTTTAYYGEVTFTTNPQTRTIRWGNNSALIQTLDVNTLRGTYAFFVRHKQNLGAIGNITMQLEVRIGPGISNTTTLYQSQTLPAIDATVLNAGLSADAYGIGYLGMMKLPFTDNAISSMEGWGLDVVQNGQLSLEILLNVTRSTGAATLYVVDLIMLPMDEALVEIITPTDDAGRGAIASGDYWHMVYDNTGYYSHGMDYPRTYTFFEQSGASRGVGYALEMRGNELTLTPGVNNRLFFVNKRFDGTAGVELSQINVFQTDIRLNIIPCSQGIRDA